MRMTGVRAYALLQLFHQSLGRGSLLRTEIGSKANNLKMRFTLHAVFTRQSMT